MAKYRGSACRRPPRSPAIERNGNAWRCEQTVRGIDGDMRVKEIKRTRLI
jgi:hypothetical protein